MREVAVFLLGALFTAYIAAVVPDFDLGLFVLGVGITGGVLGTWYLAYLWGKNS